MTDGIPLAIQVRERRTRIPRIQRATPLPQREVHLPGRNEPRRPIDIVRKPRLREHTLRAPHLPIVDVPTRQEGRLQISEEEVPLDHRPRTQVANPPPPRRLPARVP